MLRRPRGAVAQRPPHRAPHVNAEWLEGMVWADVRRFVENPGEVLERVREQRASDEAATELEDRHADLSKRLAAKQAEKERYVRAYAQDLISEDELAEYVSDLKNQTDNLRLLISSIESDLAAREQDWLNAESTEAWLLTLRERIEEVEEDSPEAYQKRRKTRQIAGREDRRGPRRGRRTPSRSHLPLRAA